MSRDIKLLHPELQEKIKELEKLCEAKGLHFKTTDTIRTKREQNDLYSKGRTTGGHIVTNVRYPKSYHNWGIAVDFCQNVRDKAFDDSGGFFSEVGRLAGSIGLEWGGAWTGFVDKPHLQLASYGNTNSLVRKYGNPDRFKKTWKKKEEDKYMKVKRTVKFNGNKREFTAINDNGRNYYSITEIAKLMGKDVKYDKNTKVTTII